MTENSSKRVVEVIYLLPGLGADERMYRWKSVGGAELRFLSWIEPRHSEDLPAYSRRMAKVVQTDRPYAIVGTSMGGMVALEMSQVLDPAALVLISSIKSNKERPMLMRLLRVLPMHRLLRGKDFKRLNNVLARLLSSGRKTEFRGLIETMVAESDDAFITWAVDRIIRWKPPAELPELLHLHGADDNLLPPSRIRAAKLVPGGSHVMILTHASTIARHIEDYLATPDPA